MRTLKHKSTGNDVYLLEELLSDLGYTVYISNYFGVDTHNAIKDFQLKSKLVVDGIVGVKTWSKLVEAQNSLTSFNNKLLAEEDLWEFAEHYSIELATVKAVNEVESAGKGFLLDGRPRILFEGHVFWKQLIKKNIDPTNFTSDRTTNILYEKWTKTHYEGGKQEYDRLEKAAGLSDIDAVHDAAYESASYGSFQIMGFNHQLVGFSNVDSMVSQMYTHEREHLKAFGVFCENIDVIKHLKSKNWASFAKGYNGPGYQQNKYDIKLAKAYKKYNNF